MPAFSRLHQATALVPLALLSAAWTVSLTGAGAATGDPAPGILPDGSTVPAEAIEAPASVSSPAILAPAAQGDTSSIIATSSVSGIPTAAIAGYQRAEAVINSADPTCEIPWELIAAIGRVESDHGRSGGNTLNDEGLAEPGIYGIALNGKNNTQKINDTDAGKLDADTVYDRAIGPMQFIPSTWSVVGVDGDNDGKRNPQDIDDAALATAVYLCSGDDNLSTDQGRRASVYRYNHSNDYVDLVLSIMQSYMDGDFSSVPNGTTSANFFAPAPVGSGNGSGAKGGGGKGSGGGSSTPTKSSSPTPTKSSSPTSTPKPTTTAATPSPTPTSSPTPTKDPTQLPSTTLPTLPPPPTSSVPTIAPALTLLQTQDICDDVYSPLTQAAAYTECVARVLGGGTP